MQCDNYLCFSSKLQVQIDDHVTTKGGHSGYIRYIGHVDEADQSQALYVGLELDSTGMFGFMLDVLLYIMS